MNSECFEENRRPKASFRRSRPSLYFLALSLLLTACSPFSNPRTLINRQAQITQDGEIFHVTIRGLWHAVGWQVSDDRTVLDENAPDAIPHVVVTDSYTTEVTVRRDKDGGLTQGDRRLAADVAEKYCKKMLRNVKQSAYDSGVYFPATNLKSGYWLYQGVC